MTLYDEIRPRLREESSKHPHHSGAMGTDHLMDSFASVHLVRIPFHGLLKEMKPSFFTPSFVLGSSSLLLQ